MNRRERRAQLHPQASNVSGSGIRPLNDELDDLLRGAHGKVPFASRDEDLTAPTPFKAAPHDYVAHFTRQRCKCGVTYLYMLGMCDGPKRVSEFPYDAKPRIEVSASEQHIPVCIACQSHKSK